MGDLVETSSSMSGGSGTEPPKKKQKKPDLPIIPIKNTADYQRMKLERLFANPEKAMVIPMRPKEKTIAAPPEFVRNIMGSSAGAGSGEFHVYRHLRRKEYARQKAIMEKSRFEELNEAFEKKIEDNKQAAEQRTAKKRAKRLKMKEKLKQKRAKGSQKQEKGKTNNESSSSSNDEDDSNNSSIEDDKNKNGGKKTTKATNGNKSSAGQKNGSNNSSNNKPKLVVPTYSSVMASLQEPCFSDDSSDSD